MRATVALAALLAAASVAAEAKPSIDPADAPAGHYALDPSHSTVLASVMHMGLSHFTMRLRQVQAAFDYDPARPQASRVTAAIDARSLDAGEEAVSKTFANEFLDADHHPQISFASTALETTGPGRGVLKGDLTFWGVTRPVSLDVTYNGYASGLVGGKRMGFSATGVIDRAKFGSRAWSGAVGDEGRLTIEAEVARQ